VNEMSGIAMDEQSARSALAAAIQQSAEAAERADRFAAQFVAAKKALNAKEGAFIDASAAHDAAVASGDDAAVLKAFRHLSEVRALWDAGKKVVEQAAAKVDNARLQCEELESSVDRAAGAVIAAIAEARGRAFLEQWKALIAEAAFLYAARRRCGVVPPGLARIFQLGVIDVAENDPRFAENFKTSKTTLAAFSEKLASDPAALFGG